jgi:integrase
MMSAFGGRPAVSITTREVSRWLSELDRDPGLSARSVNKHRTVLHGIYRYACREDTFGLVANPAAGTEKRRESDPAEIVTYTPAEVEALARAAATGPHRNNHLRLSDEEQAVRALEDEQDACVILVAAFCGLRMGECLGLRWRHIMWDAQRLHVQRSYVLGQEDSTKGRRSRTVPLADQPARALARLSQRSMFTRPADLVVRLMPTTAIRCPSQALAISSNVISRSASFARSSCARVCSASWSAIAPWMSATASSSVR